MVLAESRSFIICDNSVVLSVLLDGVYSCISENFKRAKVHDIYIRLSEKFLSFYMKIIDTQCFLFYISLSNCART